MVNRIEYDTGKIEYRNEYGEIHREDGPAVIYSNETVYWYKNGNLHREDGPAVIYSGGTKVWRKNGNLHREDGPAIIYPDGRKYWCLNNEIYPFDEWIELVNISNEEKMELVLKYG